MSPLRPFGVLLALSALINISSADRTSCGRYDKIRPDTGSYVFSNNLWGDDGSGGQCIDVEGPSTLAAKWKWSRNDHLVHSYPNIAVNSSETLPIQLSNIASLNLSLAWSIAPSSAKKLASDLNDEPAVDFHGLTAIDAKANVAVDMFLDADPVKSQNSTDAAYEMMIWIGAVGGAQPFHSLNATDNVPTLTVEHTLFSLFIGPNQSNQTVFTWLASQNLTKLPEGADFRPLLEHLHTHGHLDRSIYLGTYQIGSETYHARKSVTFRMMDVSMGITKRDPDLPAGKHAEATDHPSTGVERLASRTPTLLFGLLSALVGLVWGFS